MRTDWSKRTDPVAYQNFDETGQHTPGPDAEVVRFLVDERDVLGFGSEAIGTDAGQGFHLRPPYPCHYYMHGAGRYGLQCLTNLDLLPPTGQRADLPAAQDPAGQRQPAARAGAGGRIDRVRSCVLDYPPHPLTPSPARGIGATGDFAPRPLTGRAAVGRCEHESDPSPS